MSSVLHKYGYSSPTDGTYFIDGEKHSAGQDFRTKERYEEYKNAGFDTLLLQGNDPYRGEPYLTSQLKKNMDNAYEAGIRRIIVFDARIDALSRMEGGLIGEDKKYQNSEELDQDIAFCLKDYSRHPAFTGVMLMDEPRMEHFLSISQLEESLYRVLPDIYIHCNLLPYYGTFQHNAPSCVGQYEKYQEYIETFCRMCPQKIITMDSYPIREEKEQGKFIITSHFPGLQILCDMAKKYHRGAALVLQSFVMSYKGQVKMRKLNEKTARYQYHCALASGVKEIAYFTYWRKQVNHHDQEYFEDYCSFISNDGHQTDIYRIMEKMHREEAYKEDYLSQFDYVMSTVMNSPYGEECKKEDPDHISVQTEGEIYLSELENKEGYCYCLVNIADPDMTEKSAFIQVSSSQEMAIVDPIDKTKGKTLSFSLEPGEMKMIFIRR